METDSNITNSKYTETEFQEIDNNLTPEEIKIWLKELTKINDLKIALASIKPKDLTSQQGKEWLNEIQFYKRLETYINDKLFGNKTIIDE